MPFSTVVQLEVPALFPLTEYELFWEKARTVIPRPSEERREFNAAASLVALRFRNCIQYQEEFVESWRVVGVAASFEEQYKRERALFGIFVGGVSTVESACYANYALAAVVLGLQFDEKSRRAATPKGLLAVLRKTAPKAQLTLLLCEILNSTEWELWTDYRNTMAHRSSVPRIIFASTGTLPPANILEYGQTWSTPALSGNEQALSNLVGWVASTTKKLLEGGIALIP